MRKWMFAAIGGVVLLVLLTGHSLHGQETAPRAALAGSKCRVFLRGDASGLMLQQQAPAEIKNLITLSGTLSHETDTTYVIEDADHLYWIPKANVAYVEISK